LLLGGCRFLLLVPFALLLCVIAGFMTGGRFTTLHGLPPQLFRKEVSRKLEACLLPSVYPLLPAFAVNGIICNRLETGNNAGVTTADLYANSISAVHLPQVTGMDHSIKVMNPKYPLQTPFLGTWSKAMMSRLFDPPGVKQFRDF
ncbi:hypothetical protein RvY_00355, partial [Ramazzottius varieornatus]